MKFLTDLGLYLHIPFCQKRCAYCDFYSGVFTEELMDNYLKSLTEEIKKWGGEITLPINTIYLGGGTPSLLNERLTAVLDCVRGNYKVTDNCEITLEINPQPNIKEILVNAKKAGINRLSIGIQTSDNQKLKLLGRTHTKEDAENAVKTARKLGFSNISLDLMIGLPDSDKQTLKKDLDFLISLNPEHISCYILKIEQNTAFYKMKTALPDENNVSEQYLFMCDYLENKGYSHYEISNFCKENYESRHNLKYWKAQEYLGIGPSAHSFLSGKRFYYPKDLKKFINSPQTVFDDFGGQEEEKIMLNLRLRDGIDTSLFSEKAKQKCELFSKNGLGILQNNRFCLTDKGMLVSNAIICEILEVL